MFGGPPQRNGSHQQKALPPGDLGATSVHFTGSSGTGSPINSRLHWIADTSYPTPDADALTRAAAFVTAAYCYVAMWWRASRTAEPPLMVVKETNEGEEWQPKHPLAGFLLQPRPDIDMAELLVRTMYYRDLTGAALWDLAQDPANGTLMATPFAGPEFKSAAQGNLIYGQYQIYTSARRWEPRRPEDVIHFRDVNPSSWHTPVSRVDVALHQLNLGHTVNRITHHFLNHAMFPGGVLSPDKEWRPTDDEWEMWKEAVEAWQAGPARAGKPLGLPGGTTFTRTASGMADLLPVAVLDRVESTVCAVFGTPPVILGLLVGLQNSPWSQMSEARRMGYEDTIEPLWRDLERRIGGRLLTPEERAQGLLVRFDTEQVRALKDDEEQKARISALNADIWTRGERRLYTGQELLKDERDDEIVGAASAEPPPADVGTDPEVDADGAPAKAGGDARDLTWLIFDLEAKAGERTWESMVYAELQVQQAQVVAAARRHLGPAAAPAKMATQVRGDTKTAEQDAEDAFQSRLEDIIDESRPRLAAKAYPLLVNSGGKAVRRLSARVGVSFQLLEPGLLKYAREESAFLASVMGETTGPLVAKAVQEGLAAGDTLAGLIERLEQLPAFNRERAKLTARTETTRAWNGAQRRSMSEFSRSAGRIVTKSWLSSRDERVREEHADLDDGEYIPVNQDFRNGLQEPGEPNCRCTLVYQVGPAGEDTEPSTVDAAPE